MLHICVSYRHKQWFEILFKVLIICTFTRMALCLTCIKDDSLIIKENFNTFGS